MPIVDVQLVREEAYAAPGNLAARLAAQLAKVFQAQPGRVWVRVQVLPASGYAENGMSVATAELPTFVSVLHSNLPPTEALAEEALAVSQSVATVLGCPADRVHVEYAAPGRGRVAFGGKLVQ